MSDRKYNMQKPYENKAAEPEMNLPRFSRKNALWLFLITAAGLILSGFFSGKLENLLPRQEQIRNLCISLMYYLPFCVLAVYVSVRRNRAAAMSIRPNPIGIGAVLYISVLAVLCVFFISDLSLIWCMPLQKFGFDVFKTQLSLPADPALLVLSVFTTAAIPGICEELVFRGVVLPGFENNGSKYAVRMSALLFALLHGSVTGFPGQFVLGMILAHLVVCADSIYAGMIFHTVYNAAVMIIEFLQRDLPAELACPADIFASIGGGEGLLFLVLEILLIGWMLRFSLNVFYVRGRLHGVQIVPNHRKPFTTDEKILLAAGLLMAALLFVSDALYMLK